MLLEPFRANTDAMKTEAQFLVDRVIKLAPSRQYTDWFVDFEEALLGNLETRTWPTAKEISKAAKVLRQNVEIIDYTQQEKYQPDELKINADRINRREKVGENYIFGTMADQMVRTGLLLKNSCNRTENILTI